MLPAADAALPEQLPVCPEHPERPSLATCERCGRFLCEACAVTREPPRCADCHARVGDPLGILSQPFSVGSAFANGWTLFRRALPGILPIALLFGVPGGLLGHAVKESAGWRSVSWTSLFEATVGLLAMGANFALMVGIAEGSRVSVRQALRQGLSSWRELFGVNLIQGVQILLYSLLFLIPGIIKAVNFALCLPAAFREPGHDALKTSATLVNGRRWEVFGMLVGCYGIATVPGFAAGFVFGLVSYMAPSTAPVMAIFTNAGSRLGHAFIAAVSLAAFYGFKHQHGEPLEPR